jgi:DNA-binding SARP family transcriptional activator
VHTDIADCSSTAERDRSRVFHAKLIGPRARGLVRPRLLAQLDGIWDGRLATVVAPAGSGKTTLISQYAADRGIPAAWYHAERSDGDAGRLISHLDEAVAGALGRPAQHSDSLDDLLAALELWSGPRALIVFDDLHHLDKTPAMTVVERLVMLAPQAIRVIGASRTPPSLNLSRLRLADDLCEITAEDLRFRQWEVARLFREVYEEPLPAAMVEELTGQTGGWAAGLRLARLSAPRAGVIRPATAALAGRSRMVANYLAGNVLADLSDQLTAFVRRSCVLGLLTPVLCDRLLGASGSAALLDELDQRQICRPTGEAARAYRYTPLLQSYLEWELHDQLGPAGAAKQFREAARLLEEVGAYADAVRASARGEDWAAVRRLLQAHGEQVAGGPPWPWDDVLPAQLTKDDPWLLLAAARRRYAAGQLDLAMDLYDRAEQAFGDAHARHRCRLEQDAVSVWTEHANLGGATWSHDLREAIRRRPLAHARLPLNGPGAGTPGPTGLLTAGLAALLAGHLSTARQHLRAASTAEGEAGPCVMLGARLALQAIQLLWSAGASAQPNAQASPHLERRGLDALALDADLLGLPWLARVGRALSALSAQPRDIDEAAAVGAECELAGDAWGALLAALFEGAGLLAARRSPTAPLERAVVLARQLDAGVLETWARTMLAVSLARAGTPDAELAARSAEACARGAEVPAAQAISLLTLAHATEPADCRAELLQLACAQISECGLAPARLAAWLRLPPMAASAPAGTQPPGSGRRDGGHPMRRSAECPAECPAEGPTEGPTLELRLLGGFELRLGGQLLDLAPLRPRARAALRLLALHAGQPVHRETLVEALWPELSGAAGLHRLQVAVSSVRRFLDPAAARGGSRLLARVGDAYLLQLPAGGRSDLVEFHQSVRRLQQLHSTEIGTSDTAAELLARALALYRGELLPEDGPAEWVVADRERVRLLAAEMAARLGELELRRGNPRVAAVVLARGLAIDQFRDDTWRSLITAHEAAGNLAAAAQARRGYADVLAELGLDAQRPGLRLAPATAS